MKDIQLNNFTKYLKDKPMDKKPCIFKMYGNEEKRCVVCGYIIPATCNDLKALEETIKSTTEKPRCKPQTNG